MTDLEYVEIDPEPPYQHTHTAIFLHGRGDAASNFSSALYLSQTRNRKTFYSALPTFRWVFPESEMRVAETDGDGEEWCQWFDIFNFWDFSEGEEVAAVGLRESVASILKIIDREAALLGGRRDRIVLMGISQGAAVGMHVLLNMSKFPKTTTVAVVEEKQKDEQGKVASVGEVTGGGDAGPNQSELEHAVSSRLGAFVSFSSWLPYVGLPLSRIRKELELDLVMDPDPDDTVVQGTPVLMEHCADDWTVKFQHGIAARDAFQSFGALIEWKAYPNGGHWFKAPEGVEDAVAFIRKHVPDVPEMLAEE